MCPKSKEIHNETKGLLTSAFRAMVKEAFNTFRK